MKGGEERVFHCCEVLIKLENYMNRHALFRLWSLFRDELGLWYSDSGPGKFVFSVLTFLYLCDSTLRSKTPPLDPTGKP